MRRAVYTRGLPLEVVPVAFLVAQNTYFEKASTSTAMSLICSYTSSVKAPMKRGDAFLLCARVVLSTRLPMGSHKAALSCYRLSAQKSKHRSRSTTMDSCLQSRSDLLAPRLTLYWKRIF